VSELPPGWLPIPFAVSPEVSSEMAAEILRASGATPSGDADVGAAVANLRAAIERLPVSAATRARLWHGFGDIASGVVADLSVEEVSAPGRYASETARFARADAQRRVVSEDGTVASLSAVAADATGEIGFLLRVQSPQGHHVRVVDVLDRDLRAIGAVWDDAVAIARG